MAVPYERIAFDFDTWTYDIAFAAQPKDGELMSWEWVMDVVDTRVREICTRLGVNEYHGYLTGKGNFRDQIATSDKYKGNRKQEKPRYYQPIRDYLVLHHKAIIVNGMEADDALAVDLTNDKRIICVSRDKDLRQVEGWHYGYSVGKQAEFQPQYISFLGELSLTDKRQLKGNGLKFFFSQVLTGDSTDHYKGAKGRGPVFAYNLIQPLDDPDEIYDKVRECFEDEAHFREQCLLAWMIRSVDSNNNPILPTIERGFYNEYNNSNHKP